MPNTSSGHQEIQIRPQIITLTLSAAAMLGMLNGFALGPFMPDISDDVGVSIPLLGQVATATFVGAMAICLFAGPLADLYGKRRIITVGLLTLAVSAAGTALAPDFGWLLAARMVSAVSAGTLAGTTLAMAGTMFDGDDRRRALAWIASGVAVGGVIGIPVLTLIAALSSWRMSFGVVAVAGLLGVFAMRRMIPDDAIPGSRLQLRNILSSYRPLIGDRPMLSLYGSTTLRAIGWVGTLTYIGAYFADELGLSTAQIGWAYMVGGGGYFVGTKIAGSRFQNINLRTLYGISTLLMGIFLGLSISLPAGAIPSICLVAIAGITGGVGWVGLVTLISTSSPAGQGTTMSLNAAMFQIGSALGGLFGGLLLAVGGYATLGLGLMAFAFLAASLVWRPSPMAIPARPKTATAVD
ncbi:MAG: MFS transporter [Thermomicrobiales bacterium]